MKVIAVVIVALILIAYSAKSLIFEGYDPGLYVSGSESKCGRRSVPMLLDDSGTDNSFWLFDRQRDRIDGLYRDAKWIRTGCCDLPFTYDKMLPWGSRLYVSGGN